MRDANISGSENMKTSERYSDEIQKLREARALAAAGANYEDASVWRWFSAMFEAGKIRWCLSHDGWLVSVNHRHVATSPSFDEAIRTAMAQSSVSLT
ncbi:hypothetical protein AWB74_07534 [Caballeronia arvi]|uniref:Uncharacterized protein n=1 Tax=Caballeronia arvi TaxID=1777135 RepID=A0A158KY12_9BURK|nr:hypothetical protein [Caballeronia arvi]SAL86022.1 hypothetical protein AWB74_07534 [Caballeronia arvi]